MRKEEKAQVIDEVVEILAAYPTVYVTDISGLTVAQSNELRRTCFKKGLKLKMVKNTFLKRAMEQSETDYSEMYPALHGTSAIMVAEIGNLPARTIKEFRGAKNTIPAVKAAYIEESVYLGDQLDFLCSIKSKDELIAEIIRTLQSPSANVISALQSVGFKLSGLVKTLSEKN